MLTLLKLPLKGIATHNRVVVLVDALGEVLAGRTDHATFPVGMFSGLLRIRFGGDTSTLDASAREWHRHL